MRIDAVVWLLALAAALRRGPVTVPGAQARRDGRRLGRRARAAWRSRPRRRGSSSTARTA